MSGDRPSQYRGSYPGSVSDASTLVFRGRVPPNTAITGAATINWTEDTDTHAAHSSGTLTIPTGLGGLYQISLAWKPDTAISISLNPFVNGTQVVTTPSNHPTAFTGLGVTLILPLAASNALTIRASNSFTTTNDTFYNTWFHVVRLRS